MEIAVIILFFLAVILFGFCRGLSKRSRSENVFYAVCIVLSLSVLLLKCFEVAIPDPTRLLAKLFH